MNEKENQLLRVILQQLETLGFTNTVAELQTESGVLLHSDPIVNLTSLVLNGDWEMAQDALVSLQLGNINEILFLIRCHVYIELLYNSNLHMALDVLQNLVTPVASDNVLLHKLSSLLFLSIDSIPVVYNFDTDSNNNGRANLLSRLKLLVSPHIMLPDNRLQVLIDQALEYQKSNCLFHNSLDKPTCLLTNHVCDRSVFPTKASMIFNHSDEVWFTVFSHNGLYLASASKDNSCMIWDITTGKSIKLYADHTEAVSHCQWSPDDSMLLTGSNDKTLRLWDNNTGKCIQTYIRHNEIISACAWLPCGTKFVSGSVDKFVYLWNINGDIIHKWSGMRIHDLAITKCGEKMIAMSEKRVVVFSIKNLSPLEADSPILQTLIESDSITSMTLSRDSKYLLVNMSTQEIHLWDIELQKIIKKYNGHKQGRFVIRSSFAGVDENFVICGSDDSLIYVWHRERAEMISYLQGHDGCVNSVSWSSIGNMFASASDDGTVRVWT